MRSLVTNTVKREFYTYSLFILYLVHYLFFVSHIIRVTVFGYKQKMPYYTSL